MFLQWKDQLSEKQTSSLGIFYLTSLFTYSTSYSSFSKNPQPDFFIAFFSFDEPESLRKCVALSYAFSEALLLKKKDCFPTPFLLVLSVYPSSINTVCHLGFVNSLSTVNISFLSFSSFLCSCFTECRQMAFLLLLFLVSFGC